MYSNKVNNAQEIVGTNNAMGGELPLSFKEWKMLKKSHNKQTARTEITDINLKPNSNDKNTFGASRDIINIYNKSGCNAPTYCIGQVDGGPGSMQTNYPGGINGFGMRSNCTGLVSNGLNNFNFSGNVSNRFDSYGSKYFTTSNVSMNSIARSRNRLNCYKDSNFDLPASFFSSDGIFRQKDMMQKPLLNINPFRNENKHSQMLQEFNKSRYNKFQKNNSVGNKKPGGKKKKFSTNDLHTVSGSGPKVYVPNPKTDGKPFVPKPKIPEANFQITKEEKKQQWKKYRDAMKPYKNREFYNAKRVVQRLGKKDSIELDEKQIFRLAKARELMEAHKSRLSEKYPNYIKDGNNSNELGELYVLKKKSINDPELSNPANGQFENNGNFGVSS